MELTEGDRTIFIHRLRDDTHADGMLMVYLPLERILVEGRRVHAGRARVAVRGEPVAAGSRVGAQGGPDRARPRPGRAVSGARADGPRDGGRGADAVTPAGPATPTAFLMHPASSLHDTGWGHLEHQGRLRALASALGSDLPALHGRVEAVEAEEIDEEELLRVHTREHVEIVRAAVAHARRTSSLVELDPDTRVSSASWQAALGSVGGAITASLGVEEGRWANAFVATRPPGHHATPDRAMGFCLFNTVAVTARWLQERKRADRVAVVDWDVHPGTEPRTLSSRTHRSSSSRSTNSRTGRERGEQTSAAPGGGRVRP